MRYTAAMRVYSSQSSTRSYLKGETMIRTNSVTLNTVPNAIAYRRKSPSGGAAIVIIRADEPQPGIAAISKTSGAPIIMANTPTEPYPTEAFEEAIELTFGMPYRKQGKPAAPQITTPIPDDLPSNVPANDGELTEKDAEVIVDSEEYQRLVEAYTDKKGRLSYDLMNKEMIQFAHRSEMVARMVGAGELEETIIDYIVGTKFRNATGNKDLTDEQVAAMAELIDEVSPKGAFKELKAKIRSMLAEAKR